MRHLAVPLDTTPEMARLHADVQRRAGPARRLEMVGQMIHFACSLKPEGRAVGMSQEEFTLLIAAHLDRAGIPFMVVGSLASSAHGKPRFTEDADIVIDPTPEQLEAFLAGLGQDVYVSAPAAREALQRRGMFNVIGDGWKAYLIFRKDRPFDVEELARRKPIPAWPGQGRLAGVAQSRLISPPPATPPKRDFPAGIASQGSWPGQPRRRPGRRRRLILSNSGRPLDHRPMRYPPLNQAPIPLAGTEIPFATAEDVILSKLEWDRISPSERQIRDALHVAITQADDLDRAYLRKWAPELGVSERLEELLAEADRFLNGPRP